MHKIKKFYENHSNFSNRTYTEYLTSPGIRFKFNEIKRKTKNYKKDYISVDLGSSGNSILLLKRNNRHKIFLDIANRPLKNYKNKESWNPICGDIEFLPIRNDVSNFSSVLDVLEHVKRDKKAIKEILRITNAKGMIVITVPHSKTRYNSQDLLIGHYRRYDIPDILKGFLEQSKLISIFNIYGRMMNISLIQSKNPDKVERSISWLREKYLHSSLFRVFWNVVVKILTFIMNLDAKLCPNRNALNIGLIFEKL